MPDVVVPMTSPKEEFLIKYGNAGRKRGDTRNRYYKIKKS